MKWLQAVSNTSDADVPKLFSTSYGEDESSWSFAAAQRLNAEFIKAGARGISLLYASGDEGANWSSTAVAPRATNSGSSPYVTAVGGPSPPTASRHPDQRERDRAVERAASPATGRSRRGKGRGGRLPQAVGAARPGDARLQRVGPRVPGRVRAGDQLLRHAVRLRDRRHLVRVADLCRRGGAPQRRPPAGGKPSLGFLNPLLYANAAALNDVTTGSSSGCGFSGGGWPATAGWDAVTGAGHAQLRRPLEDCGRAAVERCAPAAPADARARAGPYRVITAEPHTSHSHSLRRRRLVVAADGVRHHEGLPQLERDRKVAREALEPLADAHQLGGARARRRREVLVRLAAPRLRRLEDEERRRALRRRRPPPPRACARSTAASARRAPAAAWMSAPARSSASARSGVRNSRWWSAVDQRRLRKSQLAMSWWPRWWRRAPPCHLARKVKSAAGAVGGEEPDDVEAAAEGRRFPSA